MHNRFYRLKITVTVI